MKNLMKILLPVLALGLTFTSCKKDDDGLLGDDTTDKWFFSCDIDGDDYTVTGLGAYVTDFTDDYTIYGVDNPGNTVYIALAKGSTEGTYSMDDEIYAYVVYTDGTAYATIIGDGNGTVTITDYSTESVSGTFSFTAHNFDNPDEKVTVTNGEFNVEYR